MRTWRVFGDLFFYFRLKTCKHHSRWDVRPINSPPSPLGVGSLFLMEADEYVHDIVVRNVYGYTYFTKIYFIFLPSRVRYQTINKMYACTRTFFHTLDIFFINTYRFRRATRTDTTSGYYYFENVDQRLLKSSTHHNDEFLNSVAHVMGGRLGALSSLLNAAIASSACRIVRVHAICNLFSLLFYVRVRNWSRLEGNLVIAQVWNPYIVQLFTSSKHQTKIFITSLSQYVLASNGRNVFLYSTRVLGLIRGTN